MGVVSGIVMSYQFGTNWSVFSDKTGPVLGPLMGYEVLSAFFLEAGFLGVMLFGLKRVGPRLHFLATLMVAVGTLMSAFWILSVNSWMQTPAGYAINDKGQFVPIDWWAVVFNPSFPYRLVHMVLAAYLTTAFVVGAVGAYHLLRDKTNAAARLMFSMALWMAVVVTPMQIVAGDLHGLNTLEHQPMKIAGDGGPLRDEERRAADPVRLARQCERDRPLCRRSAEARQLHPHPRLERHGQGPQGMAEGRLAQSPLVFWSFRIMVGIGFAMLGIGLWSLYARFRGGLPEARWLQRAAIVMGPSGFVAVLAGWITTEVGRQPYTVYGLLRTADSVSPIAAAAVGASLVAFVIVYFAVFGAGTFYLLRLMAHPPKAGDDPLDPRTPMRAAGITPGPPRALATRVRKEEH